jgi:leucyl-tRNA synthetase
MAESTIEIPVQVNGKLRAVVQVPKDVDQDTLKEAVKAEPKVQASISGKEIVKVIVVPGKLINIVAKG